jgi:hypothetical protein
VIQLVIPILCNNETIVKGSKHKKADEQCNKSDVNWSRRSSTLLACFADWSGGTNNGLRCTHYQESVESENIQILG